MNNIQPINADGVGELMLIGAVLKACQSHIAESSDEINVGNIDEAVRIIDQIIDDGFASI